MTISSILDSPVGPLTLTADERGLTGLWLDQHRHGPTPVDRAAWREDALALGAAREQLTAWFAGDRRDFDLQLAPVGTAFQLRVWAALRDIPFGASASYAEIAAAIGAPRAVRAVGAANGRNPLSIVVPCHRVIGSDGSLTGYGGGMPAKRWLLDHERRVVGDAPLTLL